MFCGTAAQSTLSAVDVVVRDLPPPPVTATVSSRSASTLSDGDVITIEPGIYLPGLGGIRIEDTVAVTGGGGRSLTTTSKALRAL